MQTQKVKVKGCHGCGLEDAEIDGVPVSKKIFPCCKCTRNPSPKVERDYYAESWTLNEHGEAFREE